MTMPPSEIEYGMKLQELGKRIDPELLAELRAAHDKVHCAAYSEGLWCCFDYLSGEWDYHGDA